MDWKVFLAAFTTIFLAELGDKTQLATLLLASGSTASKWVVFAGAGLALLATTAIAVVAGEAVTRVVPAIWLTRISGVLFIVLGVVTLVFKSE